MTRNLLRLGLAAALAVPPSRSCRRPARRHHRSLRARLPML